MSIRLKLQTLIQKPCVVALILLGIFFLTTGYKYGWDDQHLEIPLLKHLIDEDLYHGDYYVESLEKNFSSFFYPILAKLISVSQVPFVYFLLYYISRYFLFYWIYKLWLHISKSPFQALTCILSFILLSRIEEFMYRTFSHQEFAFAFIFAGIYYFFKERFFLSSFLLGIAANIHALYSAFPMFFIGLYLLWQVRKHGIKTLLGACIIFIAACAPFILWNLKGHLETYGGSAGGVDQSNWIDLYLLACPQNFFFPIEAPFSIITYNWKLFFNATHPYLAILALFFTNLFFNKDFRTNKKAIAFSVGAFILLVICCIYTYFQPSRFVVDLNLIRNTQYLKFLLIGFISLLVVKNIEKGRPLLGLGLAIGFSLLKYTDLIIILSLGSMAGIFIILWAIKQKNVFLRALPTILGAALIVACAFYIRDAFNALNYRYSAILNLSWIFVLLVLNYFFLIAFDQKKSALWQKRLFVIIPLVIYLCQFSYYRFEQVDIENNSQGYWRVRRSWLDMQHYVKENTPKDSMLLVPYDMMMGGFRMFSERKIVASYRDCGIVGFDYAAALEWERRIKEIKPFTTMPKNSPKIALKNAILKYNASHIVFMRYSSPAENNELLERVYTNQDFTLFKVRE